MKPCSKCRKKRKTAPSHSTLCWECNRKKIREHYTNNKQYYIKKARARREKLREENTYKVVEYLLQHPCVDCKEPDPIVLDFDHLRDKAREISIMVQKGISWTTIKKEIAKCDVVCSNCHRRRTAKRKPTTRSKILGLFVQLDRTQDFES